MITPEQIATHLEGMAEARADSWRIKLTRQLSRPLQEQGLWSTEKSNEIDQMVGDLYPARLEAERRYVLQSLAVTVRREMEGQE